jgi:transcriptional regulator with XRE-family HTH domain
MHVAQRFELFLETYRRPDGHRWTGQQLDEATGGGVTRSYVTNLRKGRIDNPGYEKMRAIAKAMSFAPEAWFEENVSGGMPSGLADESSGVSGRLEHLFQTIRNPKTGEPYTNAEVARMALGDLSEEEVGEVRSGSVGDPTAKQISALAGVFGVEPSYLLDRREPPLLDEELVQALRDEDVRDVARRMASLPKREREIVLGIVRQIGETR